jgi:hypothetical protein
MELALGSEISPERAPRLSPCDTGISSRSGRVCSKTQGEYFDTDHHDLPLCFPRHTV